MKARWLLAAVVVLGLVRPGSARAGSTLNPFRHDGTGAASLSASPFRVAAADAPATPAPAPAAPAAPAACTTDDQCPNGTICQAGTCQAVQRATNIAWLYYREGSFREILGLYWEKRGSSGYTFLVPLYWHAWSPKRELYLIPPLALSTRTGDSSFTWIAPLNFGWRDKDREHQLVIPLLYATRHKTGGSFYSWFGYESHDGNESSGSVLWAFWWGENRKERSGYNVLFPLLWDFREGEDRSSVFFPFLWSYSSAGSNSTILGPILHLRRPTWTFDAVFPVWWSGTDAKSGTAFKMFVPLFYWKSANQGRRQMWVSPIGGYSSDADARSRTLALLPLLSFWHKDPESETRVFTPLYVRQRSETQDATTTWLGVALFYRRDDPKGSTTAVTPLYWHFHDAATDATANLLFPVFARRDGPRDTTTAVGVLPFVWGYWRNFKGGGWSAGLFPVAFFGQNAGRSHAIVAPLFWRWAGANESTTVLAPFFYWHRDPRGNAGGVPALLAFWGRRDGDSYAIQFPLFWHFASEHDRWSTTVTPIGYYHRDDDGWSAGVPPVLWLRSGAKRSHAVLFPLFWRFRDDQQQKTTTVVGPYYHRSWGGETTDGLFPLLHYRRGARPGGGDETSFTLFPLLHYHRDAQTRVLVSPIGASARGPNRQAGFLGPYFWYRSAKLDASFVPLLYADVTRRDTGERTRQVGLWWQLEGPGRKAWALFPLFGHYADAKESDTWVFPSFFRARRADGSKVDALLPLYWHASGDGRTSTVVGLWYDRTAPGVHNTGLFPLWFHARNTERSLTVIPPLLFVRREDYKENSERLWCLLLWHTRDKDRRSTTVFPVWWSTSSPGKSRQVLFPVYWHKRDDAAKSSWTLAGPLYWSRWDTGYTRGLLPLFWYSRDPADGAGTNALMPLFYEAHGPKQKAFMTPLFGYRRTPESRLAYAGPVVPLWFSYTNTKTERHSTVFLPLLYFGRSTPDSQLRTVAGLFWRHHDVTSATTLVLPLFYDINEYHLSRTTMLLPFFMRFSDQTERSVTWLAPLFYRRSAPESSTTVAFPLVWDFRSGTDRTTLVLPFVGRFRRADHVSTWVFPSIYHRTGLAPNGQPDGTWRTIVAPFWDASVKRPGDFAWDVLGGLFGHERVGRNRYLKLFFFRFEQEPAPRAQTAWYSQPARTPRREASRGLSLNTW